MRTQKHSRSGGPTPKSKDYETRLWEAKVEVRSYAELFVSLGNTSLEGESLYGVGLAFERLAAELETISDGLGERGAFKNNSQA